MTLICRPPGRGNWRCVYIEITGRLAELDFFIFFVGQIIELGEGKLRLRVAEIRA